MTMETITSTKNGNEGIVVPTNMESRKGFGTIERERARGIFSSEIEPIINEQMKSRVYFEGGREYPIVDYLDCMIANPQAGVLAVDTYLKQIRNNDDYFLQEVAGKELEMYEKELELAKYYREQLSLPGADIEELSKKHPMILALMEGAKDRFYKMNVH